MLKRLLDLGDIIGSDGGFSRFEPILPPLAND
jgi:hypothetical protein